MKGNRYIRVIYSGKNWRENELVKVIIDRLLKLRDTKRYTKQCVAYTNKDIIIDFYNESVRNKIKTPEVDTMKMSYEKNLLKRYKRLTSGEFEDWFDYSQVKAKFDKQLENFVKQINEKAIGEFIEASDGLFYYVSSSYLGYPTVKDMTSKEYKERSWRVDVKDIFFNPLEADSYCLELTMEKLKEGSLWYKKEMEAYVKMLNSFERKMERMEHIRNNKNIK